MNNSKIVKYQLMCQLEGMLVLWISFEAMSPGMCWWKNTILYSHFAPALISYDLIVGSILGS